MPLVRVLTRVLGGVLILAALIATGIVLHGWSLVELKQNRRVPEFKAASDSAAIARGRHLAEISCAGCHSPTFEPPMAGSAVNFLALDSTHTIGTLWAPNLTPGSAVGDASDGLLARAIREGIGIDGHALVVMPSGRYHDLSDADLAALIGFLRTQQRVDRAVPRRKLGLTPYTILGLHRFPVSVQPAIDRAVVGVAEDTTPAYGRYLVSLATCQDCHGEQLRGSAPNSPGPHAPDIAGPTATLDFATFDRALRGGVGFKGQALNPKDMPFGEFRKMTDVEARAIYTHVHAMR
jgi:mono/diheme cytochrome c family protein